MKVHPYAAAIAALVSGLAPLPVARTHATKVSKRKSMTKAQKARPRRYKAKLRQRQHDLGGWL